MSPRAVIKPRWKNAGFLLKLGMGHRDPLSPLLNSTVLEVLIRKKKVKEIKGMQAGKKGVKPRLSADHVILYLKP